MLSGSVFLSLLVRPNVCLGKWEASVRSHGYLTPRYKRVWEWNWSWQALTFRNVPNKWLLCANMLGFVGAPCVSLSQKCNLDWNQRSNNRLIQQLLPTHTEWKISRQLYTACTIMSSFFCPVFLQIQNIFYQYCLML